MLSFYDWYADLPVASPQVFGDQTDVPESADWFGRRLSDHVGLQRPRHPYPGRALHDRGPVPRPEGRRGVAGLRGQHQVRRRVAAGPPRHRRRLAMAMGHVILKEFFVDRPDAVLHRLRQEVHRPAVPGHASAEADGDGRGTAGQVPHRGAISAANAADDEKHGVLEDGAAGRRRAASVRPQRLPGHRFTASGEGRWNLDLAAASDSAAHACTASGDDSGRTVAPRRGSTTATEARRRCAAACRPESLPDTCVTTVFDLMLAQYGVARDLACPGTWPSRLRRRLASRTPRPGRRRSPACPRRPPRAIAREFAEQRRTFQRPVDDHRWARAPTTGSTPTRSTARSSTLTMLTGCQGVNGGGWARTTSARRSVRPVTGWSHSAFGARLVSARRAQMMQHGLLVPGDRPVALRPARLPMMLASPGRGTPFAGRTAGGRPRRPRMRLDADATPTLQPQPAGPGRRGAAAAGKDAARHTCGRAHVGACCGSPARIRTPRRTSRGA